MCSVCCVVKLKCVFNGKLTLLEVSLDSQLKNLLQVTSKPAIPIIVMGFLSNSALAFSSQNFRRYFGPGKCFFQSDPFLTILGNLCTVGKHTYRSCKVFQCFHLKFIKNHISANEFCVVKNVFWDRKQICLPERIGLLKINSLF